MNGGSRKLSSSGLGHQERADALLDAGRTERSGVALRKQIGLFSACGIIIGEFLKNMKVNMLLHLFALDLNTSCRRQRKLLFSL